MKNTQVEINFMKFDNTMNDLNRGDYFITKDDPTRLYLFTNKCVVDVETGEDFEDYREFQEIQILEKVKITVDK